MSRVFCACSFCCGCRASRRAATGTRRTVAIRRKSDVLCIADSLQLPNFRLDRIPEPPSTRPRDAPLVQYSMRTSRRPKSKPARGARQPLEELGNDSFWSKMRHYRNGVRVFQRRLLVSWSIVCGGSQVYVTGQLKARIHTRPQNRFQRSLGEKANMDNTQATTIQTTAAPNEMGGARAVAITMYCLLLVSYVLMAADRYLFPVIAPSVRREFGFSPSLTGLLTTIFTLGLAVGGLTTGYILSRFSRRAVMLVGIAIFS